MGGEFEKFKMKLAGLIEMNTTTKNEHVAETERKIRNVKERCRSTKADMPYRILPNPIIKAMVIDSVLWMNAWRAKNGISVEFSLMEIVLRWQLNTKLHCQAHFGSYCLMYDEPDITNT